MASKNSTAQASRDGAPPSLAGPSLTETALNRIRQDILTCRLAPGRKVTERELVAELGMNLAAVRNALIRLDQEGLIITQPRKGYIVAPLTLRSVDELFDYWAFLTPEIMRRGILRASEKQMEEIREASGYLVTGADPERGSAATQEALIESFESASVLFSLLAQAGGNQYFQYAHARVIGEVGRVWRVVTEARLNEARGRGVTLQPVVEAIRAGDAEGSAGLLRVHIEALREDVLKALIQWPSVSASEIKPL